MWRVHGGLLWLVEWQQSMMIGQIWGKVAGIGQNCKVVQNSQGLVENALTAETATLQLSGWTEKGSKPQNLLKSFDNDHFNSIKT